MIAFAPSQSRSRWRSRKTGCPPETRMPSQTPSPSTNPESKTETTASARGLSSPLTQIRISSLRGSAGWSWVPVAMSPICQTSPATASTAASTCSGVVTMLGPRRRYDFWYGVALATMPC